jgi:small subunit ribosomal protein MRP21
MLGLTPKKGSGLGLGELLSGMDGGELELKQIKPTPVRLKPVSGKTIHCAAGMDPARAFSALNRLTSLEKTALTQRRQRFHERPGLKRKRLKSERWRSRFAVGFAATVKRVQHLAQQGW